MFTTPKASRKSALGIMHYVKNPKVHQIASMKTVADFEKALSLGEIVNPNAKMTREQAIAKLKEAKDLLDLGIYSQFKYDSLKTVLTAIITADQ
jgi:hypothetical protein